MQINILDCTLRDGGYYNRWDFNKDMVSDYLDVMSKSEITYVELGLRQIRTDRFLGPHAYSTAAYLSRLDMPKGPTYGVMIDAKTVLQEELNQEDCIDLLFKESKDELIELVRVAAHFKEVEKCQPMLKRLKEKGYKVGLNIMQSSLYESAEISRVAALMDSWSLIDVVYFADSLGSMLPKDVKRVFEAINSEWSGEIGFHAHNNMGQALGNVNVAIELGCTWVDATVTGMGRGAGNAETEYLLQQSHILQDKYDPSYMVNLITKHFEQLKKESGWGPSIAYYQGAILGLHPTYVQELCTDPSFDKELLPKVLADLGNIESPQVFDKFILNQVKSKIQPNSQMVDGNSVEKFLQGREVLLVAQTEDSIGYKDAIMDYISAKNSVLISINHPMEKLDIPYNFVAISHNEKYREDALRYENSEYSYIGPQKMFSDSRIKIAHDYGVSLEPGVFENCKSYVKIPYRLTLAYAVGFCLDAGVESIKLVGFKGYSSDDPRQKEMQLFLNILASNNIQIESLTPTSFAIQERSIYAI